MPFPAPVSAILVSYSTGAIFEPDAAVYGLEMLYIHDHLWQSSTSVVFVSNKWLLILGLTGIASPGIDSVTRDHAANNRRSAVAFAMLEEFAMKRLLTEANLRETTDYSSKVAMASAFPSSFVAKLRTAVPAVETGFP